MSAKASIRTIELPHTKHGMGNDTMKPRIARSRIGIAWLTVIMALILVLMWAVPAFADYEQAAEHFGQGSAAATHAQGIAVNTTGAGGVQPGSFYVAGTNARVVRYTPGGEGEEPVLQEEWGWGVGSQEEGAPEEFQRCGPALATEPAEHTYRNCTTFPFQNGGEQVGHFNSLGSVAVDQTTGDVYVLNQYDGVDREKHLVEVFTATGTPVGEGFGELGRSSPAPGESIAEGPEKLHYYYGSFEAALAVDDTGKVFVADADYLNIADPATYEARVMSFEPAHPGDYENYVYSGQSQDMILSGGVRFNQMAVIDGGRLVTNTAKSIVEFSTSGGSIPVCAYEPPGGHVTAMTANAVTGEVFYFSEADLKVHRLGPCDAATGKFVEAQAAIAVLPKAEEVTALAVNPVLRWGSGRPPGVLYAADPENPGVGDVFVPARVSPPSVVSESTVGTGVASSALQAMIDPHGFTTHYAFQYLSEAEYQANEPDERQSVTVAAEGGVFGLGFEGRRLGGALTGSLTAGSSAVSGVSTGAGSATLSAGNGTATLSGAVGKGTVIAGSLKVTALSTTSGTFAAGQTLRGSGIPEGTKVTLVSGSELTLSTAATESVANTALKSGTSVLKSVATTQGVFEVGQQVEGTGIPAGATITAISGSEMTLSTSVEKGGSAVAIKAGSTILTAFTSSEGVFEPGDAITGEGIPAGTIIATVQPTALILSKPVSKAGVGVAVSAQGPSPLAVGEHIEGPGIPTGTTIAAVKAGELTLSALAETTTPNAHLHAGLPFDASTAEVTAALEGLATIGVGNVSVSGGPGDTNGTHPYVVQFTGTLANTDLPELSADSTGLSGGPASATVKTAHNGGGGFIGAREAPAGGGEINPGGVGLAAASVSGLQPGTAYRFRVIAKSKCEGENTPTCETIGAPAVFATYPSTVTGAPDERAYELVSPPEKSGGEVFPAEPSLGSCFECKPPSGGQTSYALFPMQSAPDGESVAYMGYPFSPGDPVFDSYVSRRTVTGWKTTILSPALQENKIAGPVAFDSSLSVSIIYQEGQAQLSPDAPPGYQNLYLESAAEPGVFTPLLTRAMFDAHPPRRSAVDLRLAPERESDAPVLLHSGDLSHVFFAANDVLTEKTSFAPEPSDPGQEGHNLYEWHEGSLSLVNVRPGNAGVASGAVYASDSADNHAVSADGSRVFWSAEGHLYLRVDGQRTIEVPDGAGFVNASADGSRVLLADGKIFELSAADTPAEAYAETADLTEGQGGFEGVAGTGEEAGKLSRIYFVDTATLPDAGENERHESPRAGKDNLYFWQEGEPLRYIATLVAQDGQGGAWAASPVERTAEASSDGRYLSFESVESLTGYKNFNSTACVKGGRPGYCQEVFLYDSANGRLLCASCNPTGEEPLGPSTLRRIGGSHEAFPQPSYLTDQGRLYFDSQDRLSPFDTNGNAEDVYEYEPARGPGEPAGDTCELAGGCVLLVSPGTGSADSNFLAMDESGKNVFFTTRERLVPQDGDELIDLYDAREGGGFPSSTETQRGECQGEACQSTASPPVFTTPGSTTFSGLGNVLPSAAPVVKPNIKKVTLTSAEKLSKALRVCREKHVKRKRLACERQARQANKKTKAKKHGGAK